MDPTHLQIRIVAFKDVNKKALKDTLFYVKKLRHIEPNQESPIILEQVDPQASIILSADETFDWRVDEGNYCQVLFLNSDNQSKVRADIILWFNHLVTMMKDRQYNPQTQVELPCSAKLERDYLFEFTLQSPTTSTAVVTYVPTKQTKPVYSKSSTRQPIRGHQMKLKHFNQPVYCALCNGFIWGLRYQGYECTRCSLVTDKKCYSRIPFWCMKSPYPEPSPSSTLRLKLHMPHVFRQHEAPFLRSLVTRDHSHCCHCGSKIFSNALKCTQCHLIIHEHCQSHVPPMCTIPYKSLAKVFEEELIHSATPGPVRFHPAIRNGTGRCSKSSSFDFSWLEPALELDSSRGSSSYLLPTLTDFEYIGRLGDGAFAKVYCVRHISSKQYVAIKVADGSDDQARQQLEVEKQILFRYGCTNPYMIKAYCTFHHGTRLFLIMELVQGGGLHHKIQTTRMNEDEIKFYLAEVICVLQYLHTNKIVYRDLKLEHAIVSSEGHIRLVDYGLCRLLKTHEEKCYTFCGTYTYMAPEVRQLQTDSLGGGYNYAVDFWALGIMFLQMLAGEQLDFPPQLLPNYSEGSTEEGSIAAKFPLPRDMSAEANQFIIGLLEMNPEKRLGSPNSPQGLIRDHPFFKVGRRIDWQEIEDGLFKPVHKNHMNISACSDPITDRPLSSLLLDRGRLAREEWLAAGQSTSTAKEEEQLKTFDYVNGPAWIELTQTDRL